MAKPSKSATFEIGNTVSCVMPALSDEAIIGEVQSVTPTGWYRILTSGQADRLGIKNNIFCARARSMTLYAAPAAPAAKAEEESDEIGDDEDFFQTNRDAPLPYEPDEAGEADPEGEEPEETVASKMAKALAKARGHYTKCRRPNGAATAHSGDDIAKALHDYEPADVAALADKALKVPVGTHWLRYGHLNNGQIRMNSGNRIRSAYQKALKDQDAETINHICNVLGLETEEDEAAE